MPAATLAPVPLGAKAGLQAATGAAALPQNPLQAPAPRPSAATPAAPKPDTAPRPAPAPVPMAAVRTAAVESQYRDLDSADEEPAVAAHAPAPRISPAPVAIDFAPPAGSGGGRQAARNQTTLMIGAGVLVLFVLAAIVLKPPSDSNDGVPSSSTAAATPHAPATKPAAKPPVQPQADDNEEYESSDPPAAEPRPNPVKPVRPQPRPPRPAPKPAPERDPVMVAQRPAGDNPAPPAPNADPQKQAAYRQALAEARGALAARDIESAKKKLAAARPLAVSEDDQTELARMNSLATYVAGFWDGVRESLKGLQVTDELRYGGVVAAVVDSDANGITLHTPGKNHEFTLKNMPAALAMVLAQRWFDQSATTKVFLGAFQAVDPQGDREEARRLWEAATAGGAPADDLIPLLSGMAALPNPAKGPAAESLNERQQALALKQLKTNFQADYKAAKTPELKAELGRKLFDLATDNENPAERFALLREALDLAAAGGNVMLIVEAADQLAGSIRLDPLDLKADSLARAAGATNNPIAAREIAHAALGLLDAALQEKRAKPAGKLSQAAVNAARKAKDAELVKAANAGTQKVQEMSK